MAFFMHFLDGGSREKYKVLPGHCDLETDGGDDSRGVSSPKKVCQCTSIASLPEKVRSSRRAAATTEAPPSALWLPSLGLESKHRASLLPKSLGTDACARAHAV